RNYHIAKVAHAPKDYVNEQLAKASPPNLGLIDSEEIKAAETEQLIAFDVPYFKRAFDKASITSSNGFTFGYDQDINFISSYQRFTWLKNRTFRQQQIDIL